MEQITGVAGRRRARPPGRAPCSGPSTRTAAPAHGRRRPSRHAARSSASTAPDGDGALAHLQLVAARRGRLRVRRPRRDRAQEAPGRQGRLDRPGQPRAAHARSPRSRASSTRCSAATTSSTPADRQRIYEVMLREEQRLEDLVNALLQATTIDAGRIVARPRGRRLAVARGRAGRALPAHRPDAHASLVVIDPAVDQVVVDTDARHRRARQPAVQRPQVLPGGHARSRCRSIVEGDDVVTIGQRPRPRHRARATASASSTSSPGSATTSPGRSRASASASTSPAGRSSSWAARSGATSARAAAPASPSGSRSARRRRPPRQPAPRARDAVLSAR